MKKQTKTYSFSVILLSMVFLILTVFSLSCGKENSGNGSIATITSTQVVKVFQNSDTIFTISANITSDGGSPVTERGIVYSLTANPTVSDSKVIAATAGVGSFSGALPAITANTTYYARAYAINTSGTAYSEQVTFLIEAVKVGSRFGGGIVFYLDGTGKHGLIIARNGLGLTGECGCDGVSVAGTQTAIGTGQANTTLISNSCSQAGIAARLCLDLVYNGYDDWFLPSKDELNLMWVNRNLAVDLFSVATRWSSSQNDNNTAWVQDFDNIGNQWSEAKNTVLGVRAIRAF